MNQMVSPLQVELHRAHLARQARYAATKAVAVRIDTQHRVAEEGKRIEALRAKIQKRVEEEFQDELRGLSYPSIRRIVSEVSTAYDVSPIDILSHRRTRGCKENGRQTVDIVTPRQVVMYLSRMTTVRSLPDIGSQLGGRDHTTIRHGVLKITAMMEADESFRAKVEELRAAVTGRVGQ